MELKYIEFGFENLEGMRVSGKYIGGLYIEEVTTNYRKITAIGVKEEQICRKFAVEIHRDADKDFTSDTSYESIGLFDRLSMSDITDIRLSFVDNETGDSEDVTLLPYWTGGLWDYNEAQDNYKSKLGHLYLVIGDGIKIDDYFPLEHIDNPTMMKYNDFPCEAKD